VTVGDNECWDDGAQAVVPGSLERDADGVCVVPETPGEETTTTATVEDTATAAATTEEETTTEAEATTTGEDGTPDSSSFLITIMFAVLAFKL